ncbi:KH domain-containing protein At4g18375-like isoform X1 [Dioscorea cayenensis subsp. rotundata]|uniref:KH domain-containing protein At4g18375-like isoform X1 n=2 Tax=Dioscorea cayennensis subsp. rotundata TaxID=55577 RepID=A0AB40AYA8_DIOCR|nr:KH domain-containing protein At4g18375-like isoform X1 [Dioscorea cayenensis subsp. rotundata]XP_039119784.1 KH domain-containing protein At4g18375-like isoform X1 [Dioscorea cayenensis subsp. rotundata]
MGETGKRFRHHENDGKNQKRRSGNMENSGDGELVLYRILCPNIVIGSVIGKSGKVINSLRQETFAKIKVVDPFPGADKRVISIYCYVKDKDTREVDEDAVRPLCPAQNALLKMHAAIVNALENSADSDKKHKEEALILVPASQAANIIGKSGATIKRLRLKTKANIKVYPKDPNDASHSCAMSFDNFVSITGDTEAINKALFAVSAIMYKFSPKEEISLDTAIPELPPGIIIPSDIPIYSAGSFYPNVDHMVPPARSVPPIMGASPHVPELHGFSETGSTWHMYPSALPVVSGFGDASRTEELVVHVLCPSDKIGRVIGKGGSTIKNIRQTSSARIDVDDKKDESEECLITVTSNESTDDANSSAVEAILLLQAKINDEDDDIVKIRLLVPSKVIGCLIGKSGSIISDMRKKTKADIRISKGEKPKNAASTDELVEVSGEVVNVRDALVQITLRLREDALKDKDGSKVAPPADPLYPSSLHMPQILSSVPPLAPLGYDQRLEPSRALGSSSTSSLCGYNSLQAGDNCFGSLPSFPSTTIGGVASFFEMVIPATALAKVMGKGGTNIDNIRKISGAQIEIVDSKTSRSERIAQISGTPEQKRTAENLIQAFIMAT